MQLALTPLVPPAEVPLAPDVPLGPIAVLTVRPRLRGEQLTAAGWRVVPPGPVTTDPGADTAPVGSPADWQAEWRALAALPATSAVLSDGCSAGDLRALLGATEPLPPVSDPDELVLIPAEGAPRRVRLRAR